MWNSYREFVAAQGQQAPQGPQMSQAQMPPQAGQEPQVGQGQEPQAVEQPDGPRLPTAMPMLLRQLGSRSPQQIMLIQRALNQQIQMLLQQKNPGAARRSIRGTLVNARNDLQDFGQNS